MLPNLGIHERDLLRACLTFTSLQKINDLEYLSPTEELIFLMISHLGPAATFLETDINAMLCERVRVFFIGNQKTIFKLDEPHNGILFVVIFKQEQNLTLSNRRHHIREPFPFVCRSL